MNDVATASADERGMPATGTTSEPPLHERVGRLAAVLGAAHFPAGDRAALKRMSLGTALPLAFYRLWLRHLGQEPPRAEQTAAWVVLVGGLAASGSQAHRPGRGFGHALAESGWHEARLERLLAADHDGQQEKLAADAVRFLAARGESFDWSQLARLLLARSDDARDAIHRRIATDFYRPQPRQDSKE